MDVVLEQPLLPVPQAAEMALQATTPPAGTMGRRFLPGLSILCRMQNMRWGRLVL